MREKVLATILH